MLSSIIIRKALSKGFSDLVLAPFPSYHLQGARLTLTDNILNVSTTPQQTPTGRPKELGEARNAVPLAVDVELLAKPRYAHRKNGQTETE